MKTVEDIISEIDKNNEEMTKLLTKNKVLAESLKNKPSEEWDWISTKTASKMWDVSLQMIYKKIQKGQLRYKMFEGKYYVSLSQLKEIDDKNKAVC